MPRGCRMAMARIVSVLCISACSGLVVPLPAARPAASLKGVSLPRAAGGEEVDLGAALESSTGKTMLVLGTFAADFNMIEYAQRVRFFMPQLREKGVDRYLMVVNAEAPACQTLARLLDLCRFQLQRHRLGQQTLDVRHRQLGRARFA